MTSTFLPIWPWKRYWSSWKLFVLCDSRQSLEAHPSSPEKVSRCPWVHVCAKVTEVRDVVPGDGPVSVRPQSTALIFNVVKSAHVKSRPFLSPCSHTYSQIHTLTVSLSHTLLHTRIRPLEEWCLHKCPLSSPPPPPPLILSYSLSPSLDSFSDMSAQAHLAAHSPPARPLLHPFTFLPCGISMATWKETSVLGEQSNGVGCLGGEGVGGLVCCGKGQWIRRVEGAPGGAQDAHPCSPGHL